MSTNKFLKLFLVVGIGVFLTSSSEKLTKNGSRHPASVRALVHKYVQYPSQQVNIEKIMKLNKSHPALRAQKVKGLLDVQIDIDEETPYETGKKFRLNAQVISKKKTNSVQLKWILPDHVEVVSGEVTSTLFDVEAGQVREVSIVLKNITPQASKAYLNAAFEYNGTKYAATGHFNSDIPEKSTFTPTAKAIGAKSIRILQ